MGILYYCGLSLRISANGAAFVFVTEFEKRSVGINTG